MKNIKVIEKRSHYPGKRIVILAGVHGNESFGVDMLKEVIPNLKVISGKVTFIFANLKAIKQNKRFIEFNLNRCFYKKQPKEIINTLEGKTAKEIIPYLEEADLMLDIHASPTSQSEAFIICMPQSFKFAKILPFEKLSWNWDKFEPGSTDYYMNLQNKIGICIECGYTKDPKSKTRAKGALINFLIKSKSIKGNLTNLKEQTFYKIINVYKNKTGDFRKSKEFEDFEMLDKKTIIGLDGKEKVFANKNNILLFVKNSQGVGEECFLKARKENIIKQQTLNNNKGG